MKFSSWEPVQPSQRVSRRLSFSPPIELSWMPPIWRGLRELARPSWVREPSWLEPCPIWPIALVERLAF